MSRVVIAAALFFALGVPVYAQRGMRGFSGGRVAMGRNASSMGFARAPQRQCFASRSAMLPRPASALEEQRRPSAPASSAASKSTNEPATVIVFRDGHRSEVQSYAIVGSTLWLLSNTRATKVPLADLDLDQTVKANEDRGLNFLVPK